MHVDGRARRRACPLSAQLEPGLDRAVRGKAARIRLDPVLRDRAAVAGAGQVTPNTCSNPAGPAPHVGERDVRARLREPRRLQPGGGRQPDLQRLAVRAEGGTQAAGPQQRQRHGVVGLLLRRGRADGPRRRRRRRCRRPRWGASRARTAPGGPLAQAPRSSRSRPRMRRAPRRGRDRAPRRAAAPPGATGGARVHEPGRVGVVVVEHVAGAAGPCHALEQAVAGGARGAGGRFPRSGHRAGEPVEEGDAVERRCHSVGRDPDVAGGASMRRF